MKIYEYVVKNPKITSKYGYRIHPITKKKTMHNGLDLISKDKNLNLYAIDEGYVQKIVKGQDKSTKGYGNYIWVRYPNYNLSLLHAHCKKILFKKGDKVKKDDVIAIMGSTGASTGTHLHLGMTKIGSDKWLNPENYDYIENKKQTYQGTFPKLPSRGYFKKGDTGTEVKNLQRLLNWLNGSKLKIDGDIGQLTITEVKTFQKHVKTTADGKFGKNTLKKAKEYTK